MIKQAYSTKQTANILGVSFRTIKNWIYSHKIKTFLTPTKQHRITKEEINKILNNQPENKTAIYSRVSSQKQKEDLIRQHQRLKQYCKKKKYNQIQKYSEIASGLNDKRNKLTKLLEQIAEKQINHLIIEHKDRLTRFGYNYLEQYCQTHNTIIEILDNTEIKEDLIKDLIDIMTSFCAKLYGKRSNRTKTKTAIESCLQELKT